jgi:hypothetical protein
MAAVLALQKQFIISVLAWRAETTIKPESRGKVKGRSMLIVLH